MCFGDFLLLLLMWGVSVQVWTARGIDFVGLLQLEHTEIARAKNPAAMMRARCKSMASRVAFPGATCGMYAPEELD